MTKRSIYDMIDNDIDYTTIFSYANLVKYKLINKPSNIDIYLTESILLIKEKSYKKAKEYLDKIINLDPYNINAYKYYTQIYIKTNEIDNLIIIYNKLKKIDPFYNYSYNIGICYLRKDDLHSAEIEFKKIVLDEPLYVKSKLKLIYIYKKMRNIFAMYKEYKQILLIDPSYTTTEYILSNFDNIIDKIKKIYYEVYKKEIKIETYEDLMIVERQYLDTYQDNPKNIVINLALASYIHIYDINKAVSTYKYIISIDNDNLISRHNLLRIYLKYNIDIDIEQLCLDIIRINPSYIDAYFYLAIYYNKNDELSKTKIYCNEVLKLDPSHIDIYYIIADINIKIKNINDAEMYYKKIIELEPFETTVYFKYGNLLFNTNKLLEAKEQYLKVLDIDPTHIDSIINIDAILTIELYSE